MAVMRAGDTPGQPSCLFLGIDLGTSSVKVVAVDTNGAVSARANEGYRVEHPAADRSEIDPEVWWRATAAAVRQTTSGIREKICGIGLSGQMHGVVVADEAAEPLRPAILWADSRAVDQLDHYRALPVDVRRRLANPLMPGAAGPMLGWLAENEPRLIGRARWAMQPKDWIRARLTGLVAGEPSDASATLLFDLTGGTWDGEVCAAMGIRPELLPPLSPCSGHLVGALAPAAAAQLGIPAGIPVAAGGADVAAAIFGSGLGSGQCQITIGTGSQIVAPMTGAIVPVADPVTHLYRDVTGTGHYEMAAVQNAGLSLSWVIDTLGASWPELYATAARPPRRDDPFFLPHLTGERTPYLDPSMRGAWTALAAGHTRTDLLRAALEGVAFSLADAVDSLPRLRDVRVLRLAGGGSKDPHWRQMLADILGRSLGSAAVSDASGVGAALLGKVAAGLEDLAPQAVPADSGHDPDPATVDIYAERRARFRSSVNALRTVTHPPTS